MRVAEAVKSKLTQRFSPTRLQVEDESHRHAGHAGSRPEGETHFRVEVVSHAFTGLSRVERQRLVYDTLGAEIKGGIHALSLATLTPEEDRRTG
ncbi:MAG: BolA family transcriptional regulator [Alphaproteobacteria bacterium]|nr:BolA family transcriptional regulator [Alphaproteobacteria bacterium]